MKLKVKKVNLSTGGPFIAILHEDTAKKLNIYPSDRLSVSRLRTKEKTNCVVNISSKGIKRNEIGLFDEVLQELDLDEKTNVEVTHSDRPFSIRAIKKKLEGKELSKEEIETLVIDIVNNELSEVELTYFISACYTNKLSIKETVFLTNAIANNGEILKFKDKIVCDKHCVGGVAGNRTTPIVVPIIASLGYKFPKTSSRAITSPSGTADTVEVLAPVNISKRKILKVVNKTNACMVWGGAVDLAAADDKLIKLRHPLSIDPSGMLLASIMAKKKAAGATHVLIDIPWGKGSKFEKKSEAKKLKKNFLKIGKLLNLKIRVILTDGSQPIGNGIGPALEINDIISVLKGDGPADLRKKAIFMSTEILKLIKVKSPRKKVIEVIENGQAYAKFKEIIYAQGGRKHFKVPRAKYFHNINAKRDGKVKEINSKTIAKISRLAGAPEDKTAGIYLRVKLNSKVKKSTTLYTIYSNSEQDLETVKKRLKALNPISY